jgi:hypothetical protein
MHKMCSPAHDDASCCALLPQHIKDTNQFAQHLPTDGVPGVRTSEAAYDGTKVLCVKAVRVVNGVKQEPRTLALIPPKNVPEISCFKVHCRPQIVKHVHVHAHFIIRRA